jgi:surfactin synthase thioesterase subunit
LAAAARSLAVFTFRLPGRENRLVEPALDSVEACVLDILPRLKAHARSTTRPMVLLGECRNAYLAYELARAVEAESRGAPTALCTLWSAAPYPSRPQRQEMLHELDSQHLRQELLDRGNIPDALCRDDQAFAFFEPSIRADLKAVELYDWNPVPRPQFPIHTFVNEGDETSDAARWWRRATDGPVQVVGVPVTSNEDDSLRFVIEYVETL